MAVWVIASQKPEGPEHDARLAEAFNRLLGLCDPERSGGLRQAFYDSQRLYLSWHPGEGEAPEVWVRSLNRQRADLARAFAGNGGGEWA